MGAAAQVCEVVVPEVLDEAEQRKLGVKEKKKKKTVKGKKKRSKKPNKPNRVGLSAPKAVMRCG